MIEATSTETTSEALQARIAALEAALAAERARADALVKERDRLREAYQQLLLEIQMLRRRIFVAQAERLDTKQLELEFASKQAELEGLAQKLGTEAAPEPPAPPPSSDKPKAKPKGRRRLRDLPIEEERVEIPDPELEGKAERAGFEESFKLGYRKPGPVRIVIARVKYRTTTPEGTETLRTAPMPPELFPRSLAAPSLLAKILVDKFCDGLPFYRQQQRFLRDGIELDRGTMSRWAEDAAPRARPRGLPA